MANEEELLDAWLALATLAPPLEVHELFSSGQAPERPYLIWQSRYDEAAARTLQERATREVDDWKLYRTEDMLAALRDIAQPLPRRLAAINSLAQLRFRPAVRPLLAAMREEPLANACSHAIIAIGSRRHLRRLVSLLTPATPDYLKQEAIYCLWMLNDRRGAGTLAKIALDRKRESDRTRLMATEALGNNVHKSFIQRVLAQAMNDPYIGVRMSALCAAGRLHGHIYLKALQSAIASRINDPEVIYDEPFGAHVRRSLENHQLSLLGKPSRRRLAPTRATTK